MATNNPVPRTVKDQPRYIQEAYIREFERVEGLTGNADTAKNAADKLFKALVKNVVANYQSKMTVSIHARVCEMAAEDTIPADILVEIKRIDPHPFFAVFDAGGEGISTGSVNNKHERKIWSFAAIKALANKLREGTAGVIVGHNALNQDSRPKHGRIVHAFTKKIRNSLHALAVAYINDKEAAERIKKGELDICSIEGDVILARPNPQSNWFVKAVETIQNLALGSSSETSPGFVGAGILATIQELQDKE
jgi:hypothetical protein